MKYNLTEILEYEKNRILKLHENEKNRLVNLINEQTGVDVEILKKARELNCKITKNGVLKSTPGEPIALVKKADYDSVNGHFKIGDELFVYGNYTFDVVKRNPDGSIISVSENIPWGCSALKTYLEKTQSDSQANTPEALEKNSLIKDGVWKLKQELLNSISIDRINSLYQQHPVYKDLYKLKKGPDQTSGYTADQLAFIDSWSADTENKQNIDQGMYKINLTAKDLASGEWDLDNYFTAPNSYQYFPGGLKVYRNASKKLEPTRSYCRTKIKEFAAKYKRRNSNPSKRQYIETTRTFIQDCINKYENQLKFAFSGLSDELNLLGGMVEGGVENNNDPWYIQLPRKL